MQANLPPPPVGCASFPSLAARPPLPKNTTRAFSRTLLFLFDTRRECARAACLSAAPNSPVPLQPPWQVGRDPASGYPYYYNSVTQVTQWAHPGNGPPASAPPPAGAAAPAQQNYQQPQQQQQPAQRYQQPQTQQGYQQPQQTQQTQQQRSQQLIAQQQTQQSQQSYQQPQQSQSAWPSQPTEPTKKWKPSGVDISQLPLDTYPDDTPELAAFRTENSITTAGDCPAPFLSFAECDWIPPGPAAACKEAGYEKPSSIQAFSWKAGLEGRDVVGVAKTGSGKTLGFLMPCFVHILATRKNARNGPTALVLAPTRELANQIHIEAAKFGRTSGILATCVYGGAPKGMQLREIRQGVQIIIATPGRLNDFLESRQVSLMQVSYLVFDEADRMLDMGFEPQIRKILACIPGQRQTMFYTATWPMGVRKLASEFLSSPCVVYIGDTTKL